MHVACFSVFFGHGSRGLKGHRCVRRAVRIILIIIMKRVFSIEGNIGAGKSTLLAQLGQLPEVSVLLEPIERWTVPTPGLKNRSALDMLYGDPVRNGFAFQMFALLTRLEQIGYHKNSYQTLFSERGPWSDADIFGHTMHQQGHMTDEEWHVYSCWSQALTHGSVLGLPKLSGIVYMRSSPRVCAERIRMRGRPSEKTIGLDYLQGLHDAHERHIETQRARGVPVLVMDADALRDDGMSQIEAALKVMEWSDNPAAADKEKEKEEEQAGAIREEPVTTLSDSNH